MYTFEYRDGQNVRSATGSLRFISNGKLTLRVRLHSAAQIRSFRILTTWLFGDLEGCTVVVNGTGQPAHKARDGWYELNKATPQTQDIEFMFLNFWNIRETNVSRLRSQINRRRDLISEKWCEGPNDLLHGLIDLGGKSKKPMTLCILYTEERAVIQTVDERGNELRIDKVKADIGNPENVLSLQYVRRQEEFRYTEQSTLLTYSNMPPVPTARYHISQRGKAVIEVVNQGFFLQDATIRNLHLNPSYENRQGLMRIRMRINELDRDFLVPLQLAPGRGSLATATFILPFFARRLDFFVEDHRYFKFHREVYLIELTPNLQQDIHIPQHTYNFEFLNDSRFEYNGLNLRGNRLIMRELRLYPHIYKLLIRNWVHSWNNIGFHRF